MGMFQKNIISSNAIIRNAMRLIEEIKHGEFRTLFVTENETLLGSIEMSDIRRALIHEGISPDDSVLKVIHRDPVVLYEGQVLSDEEICKYEQYKYLPILDEQKRIVGFEKITSESFRPNYAVLMAGGLGSRLGTLTAETPKPMLKVGGMPVLETIIQQFKSCGINKFMVSVNYKSEHIKSYFGQGEKFDVDISYIEEQRRLGTAGALSLIRQDFQLPFFVMNGDILSNINFLEMLDYHTDNAFEATMCVIEHEVVIPYGVIGSEGGSFTGITEKPVKKYKVNAGIYLLNPEIKNIIPQNEYFDMPELFNRIIASGGKVGIFVLKDYWIDIGRQEELERANSDFSQIVRDK